MKLGLCILICSFTLSCQTTQQASEIHIPATIEGVFTICAAGDGALAVDVSSEAGYLGSGELDWLAQRDGSWELELRNSFGQPLLTTKFYDKTLIWAGALEKNIPSMQVRENGYLEVQGHFVGIKPEEIPCFLKFKLPRSWLDHIVDYERTGEDATMTVMEEDRRVKITIEGLTDPPARRICSIISWRRFWGLSSSQLVICEEFGKPYTATLEGAGEYRLKWVNIDEQ